MTRTIQPCQPGMNPGEYDVYQPMPYPFHIESMGDVARQDFWKGEPKRLMGFQNETDIQAVDLWWDDWFEGDAAAVVGMYPVFQDSDGGLWVDLRAVDSVSETD